MGMEAGRRPKTADAPMPGELRHLRKTVAVCVVRTAWSRSCYSNSLATAPRPSSS